MSSSVPALALRELEMAVEGRQTFDVSPVSSENFSQVVK
jgi:hypothetical protein